MRNEIRIAATAGLFAGLVACSSTVQVKTGYDQNLDFSKYHTWAWKPDGSIQDPVWARRCQDVLSDQLATDGLTQVDIGQNPDLWAVMHARLSAETEVVPYSPGWGYAWGGFAPVDSFDVQIPVGTILVDLVDVRLKRVAWQGRVKDVIASGQSNEQREQNLTKALAQMFAGYPPAGPAAAPAKN
jgi:Domain of unknown function (DUF4136)